MTTQKKPNCKLLGTDGNIFALAERVIRALKCDGQHESAREFSTKLFKCKSYHEALELFDEYVEVS